MSLTLLDMTGLLHIWTLSSAAVTACTRPGQDQSQHGKERGSWSPTLNWGTTGNYWLLGEGNSVFFMNVAPKRQPCSRRLSYTQADIGSTKWTPVFKKIEHVSLWYIWSHNIWAFKWLSDFWNTLLNWQLSWNYVYNYRINIVRIFNSLGKLGKGNMSCLNK